MNKNELAKICHDANRAYCMTLGDHSQVAWEIAPKWQKDSALDGVNFHMENPDAGDAASHDNWLAMKEDEGWVWGPTKNGGTKTHPCMQPFDKLPVEQQRKDALFRAIVDVFRSGVLEV